MDRQEEYEKVKSDCWGTCVFEGRLTKELIEDIFSRAYNLGKKHAKKEREEAQNQNRVFCADDVNQNIKLQVATAAMQGILSNKILYEATLDAGEKHSVESKTAISRVALSFADALIAEVSKKGGEEL